jgi:hypothetical protein
MASIVNLVKVEKFVFKIKSLSVDTFEINLRFRTFKMEASAGNR